MANHVLEAAEAVLLDESSDPMEVVWAMAIVQANAPARRSGGRTGWPAGLLQDDCRGLARWFSSKPDAQRLVRGA